MLAVLLLVATLLLVLANAFFVASEFAIVKMRPTRLEELQRAGDRRARRALRITQKLDEYLSANQLGITLASLGLGALGEPAIAALVEPVLRPLGSLAGVTSHGIALGVSFFVITSLHTIVGELAPKSLAIQRTEQVTLLTALPLHLFYVVMWPAIWFLNSTANALVRLLGLHPVKEHEVAHTSEELRLLLTGSPAGLDPALRSMLVRAFDFRRRAARHVMSLRIDAATLRSDMPLEDAMRRAVEAGYSRYPVVGEGNAVVGYIHVRDLFEVLLGHRRATALGDLLRAPIYASMDTPAEWLRVEMQARQVPVAIVNSDSGEFAGMVTIEDLLEEIVGEIRDENDDELPPIHRRGEGVVEVDGRLLLSDLERDTGIALKPTVRGVETVGGYLLARLEHRPEQGRPVACEGYSLVPTDVVGRRVRRARIVPVRDAA